MNSKILLIAMMIGVGMLIPVQAGINAEFRRHAGHALWAGTLNFAVGLAAILLVSMLSRIPVPSPGAVLAAPTWAWIGGFLGATLVVTSVIAAPRLGAALLIACLVAGQLISSVIVDGFGLVGYPLRPLNMERILGVLLLLGGVWLIQRST